jgi:large subunit ribosomal protein L25
MASGKRVSSRTFFDPTGLQTVVAVRASLARRFRFLWSPPSSFKAVAMADIVLNVQTRDRTGTGGARETRRSGLVPGVIYGGAAAPEAVAVKVNEFRKALHSGKLMGHLIKLNDNGRTQSAIAKDIQFHPVTDEPVHFDFYRVDEHQMIRISVPVHFHNEDASPGIKRGGTLNIALHELELMAAADHIPEELVVDLTGLEIGDTIRAIDIKLPAGVELSAHDRDATVASVASSSALTSAEAGEEGSAEG